MQTPRPRISPIQHAGRLLLWVVLMGGPQAWAQAATTGTAATATEATSRTARLEMQLPPELRGIKVEEHLGRTVRLDYEFTNEAGQRVKLADYFHKNRPVVLHLVYYSCPMLCGLVLNGFTEVAKQLDWNPGENYDVVTITINPLEKHTLAAIKKNNYIKEFGRQQAAEGWHWLASEDNLVKALAEEIGFHYKQDPKNGEYLHEAAIFVLTSEGKISRYLYGIKHEPRDLRLALLEAGKGQVGTTLDRIMLFCFHYDPVGKKYAVVARRVMQVGGGVTMAFMGTVLGFYFWSEHRARRRGKTTLEILDEAAKGAQQTRP